MRNNFKTLIDEERITNTFENEEKNLYNKKINELNDSIEDLNQKMNFIQENNNIQSTLNITKRMDNFDVDFDRLIKRLKIQFSNNE